MNFQIRRSTLLFVLAAHSRPALPGEWSPPDVCDFAGNCQSHTAGDLLPARADGSAMVGLDFAKEVGQQRGGEGQ